MDGDRGVDCDRRADGFGNRKNTHSEVTLAASGTHGSPSGENRPSHASGPSFQLCRCELCRDSAKKQDHLHRLFRVVNKKVEMWGGLGEEGIWWGGGIDGTEHDNKVSTEKSD